MSVSLARVASSCLLLAVAAAAAGCAEPAVARVTGVDAPIGTLPLHVDPPTALTPDEAGLDATPRAFLAVHLDALFDGASPSVDGGPNTERAEADLGAALGLVALADRFGQKLTLMVSPPWAAYLSSPDCRVPEADPLGDGDAYTGGGFADCAALIRAVEANGHEIGFRHDGAGAPGWDGYTDVPPSALPPELAAGYVGTLAEAQRGYALLSAAGLSGVRAAAGDERPDDGWIAVTSALDPARPWGAPCAGPDGDDDVQELVAHPIDLAELANLADAGDGPASALGFAATELDYLTTGGGAFAALFDALAAYGATLEPLSTVAASFGPASDAPACAP